MEHIYQIYDQIVEEFEKLSASDQTRNMSDTSSDGMEQMCIRDRNTVVVNIACGLDTRCYRKVYIIPAQIFSLHPVASGIQSACLSLIHI